MEQIEKGCEYSMLITNGKEYVVHIYARYVSDSEVCVLYPTTTNPANPNFTTDENSQLVMTYYDACEFHQPYKKGRLFVYNGRFLKSKRCYVLPITISEEEKAYLDYKARMETPSKHSN